MFSKILIANRGEIAVRIIRACKEMGILTVAVFSEADREALHVSLADESYCIGPAPAAKSYLNMDAVLSAAMLSGAEAIHPGYGLLSEDSRFAEKCAECGITFIGPDAEAMRRMGDKDEARRTMQAADVPTVPGSGLISSLAEAKREAERIGYPLLIKARAGGGGKGIRRVEAESELENAFLTASSEAKNAFGDGEVYMERLLKHVKHVEMQIICDNFGNIACLGERECSIQRKNQKLIEESPCSVLSDEQRKKMSEAAVRAAKAVNYRGLGTVEFLLTPEGEFYFMEMNTRLQVEHPVTEMVTGIDLVKWQIRAAADMKLDFSTEDVRISGHAIECRINAEDAKDFRPCAGKVTLLHIPGGPWVRFDTALYQEYIIPPFYDSMVGKLIVHAPTREEAVRKMISALCEMVLEGVEHNRELHIAILSEDEFLSGKYATDFLEGRNLLL